MDKSFGQADQPGGATSARTRGERGPASAATRRRLMAAAAELIAELGWGRVTTRAVAERAGLPHGAVSYHFRGKQELLIEAALNTLQSAVPISEFQELATVEQMVSLIASEVSDLDAANPLLSRLMFEMMREAERDDELREQLAALMAGYRQAMVQTVRADQQRGAVFRGASPEAIATLLGAVGDGLLMHALLDPDLDVRPAFEALRAMLHPTKRRPR